MEIFGLTIEKSKKYWFKRQRDLLFLCPKCNKLVPVGRLENGDTLLSKLYSINSVQTVTLDHNGCGGKVVLYSVEEVEDPTSTANWIMRLLHGEK